MEKKKPNRMKGQKKPTSKEKKKKKGKKNKKLKNSKKFNKIIMGDDNINHRKIILNRFLYITLL